jgi:hypothetical protein
MAISSKSRGIEEARVTVNFSDSIDLIYNQIHWTPKGVSLLTKWFFAEGTEVEFAFEHQGERHRCTGVVVACHPLRRPAGHFEVILFFVETPCSKLQKAASACRIARAEEMRRSEDRYLNTFHGSARFAPRLRARPPAG